MNIEQQLKENPTLFIDLETGGLNPQTDAICSCSVILPNGDKDRTWFIKPYDKKYEPKAMEVNGLSLEILEETGVDILTFKRELSDYLVDNFKENIGKIQLAGHNVSFDISFLRECFGFSFKNLFHYHFKDSMILANMCKDIGLIPINQSISLLNIYIYLFGEDELSKNAHNSLADVCMSLEVYGELIKRLR